MPWRSSLIKVIGIMANFKAWTFFRGLDLSAMHGCLSCVDKVTKSALPSTISLSSASFPKGVAWPSSTYTVVASAVYVVVATSMTFFCSVALYATSRTALTSPATFSFHLLSASWVTRSLQSSFLFYAAAFSSSTKSRACHMGGHVSNTVNITS